jgi:hypothetical protein
MCGVTPTLEDTLINLEDELFWDSISDHIEEHKEEEPTRNEDTSNIFARAGLKLSSLRQQS